MRRARYWLDQATSSCNTPRPSLPLEGTRYHTPPPPAPGGEGCVPPRGPMEDPRLSPWDVLGFGAFETTAFVTALLVGAYSILPNPNGRPGAGVSEIRVYSLWRRGVVLVAVDVLFMAAVVVLQVVRGRRIRTIGWLLGLMVAPWAPFAGTVADAATATTTVRNLMVGRVARNEVAAVLREFLRLGHHSLTIVPIARC